MWYFLYASVIISHYLAHALYISYINLEPIALSEALPSIHHVHLKHWPYGQSHKHLHNAISQQALSHMPIRQYRFCNQSSPPPLQSLHCLSTIPFTKYLFVSQVWHDRALWSASTPAHGYSLSLNVMVLVWYQLYFTLWSCIYYTHFDFTINTYLQCCNTPVSNTPLFRAQLYKEILLILLHINIALVSLNYSCSPCCLHRQGLHCCP